MHSKLRKEISLRDSFFWRYDSCGLGDIPSRESISYR